MKKVIILLLLITSLAIGIIACSQSTSPQSEVSTNSHQSTDTKYQVTKKPSLAVKPSETKHTQEKTNSNSTQRPIEQTEAWGLSNKIAALVAIIALLQFFALFAMFRITKSNGRRQLRAYVFIHEITLANVFGQIPSGQPLNKPGPWISRPKEGPINYIIIKNSGQTPAFEVRHVARIGIWEYPLKSKLPILGIPPLTSVSTLPPGGEGGKIHALPKPLTPEQITALQKGIAAIYVYGEITYIDAFKIKRFTKYRYSHTGPIGETMVMRACEEGNEAD